MSVKFEWTFPDSVIFLPHSYLVIAVWLFVVCILENLAERRMEAAGHFVERRESMQTNNKMAVAPVGKLIWQMSIPPLISMFLQYSYNLIDSAFVARLSENALTAVSLSFPITTLMNAASIWIGVGVNVLIAGYLGQKKQDEANATVTHGLLLAFGIGALLNLTSLLIMKPYFGHSPIMKKFIS